MGLLFQPTRLTPSALGTLSRNAPLVLCFVDGSAGIPAAQGGMGLVIKFGYFTVEVAKPIRSPATSNLAELLAIETALDLFPIDKKLLIKSDCLPIVELLSNNNTKHKRLYESVNRVREKIRSHDAEILFVDKKNRIGTPHLRADQLASRARKECRGFFRITRLVGE